MIMISHCFERYFYFLIFLGQGRTLIFAFGTTKVEIKFHLQLLNDQKDSCKKQVRHRLPIFTMFAEELMIN